MVLVRSGQVGRPTRDVKRVLQSRCSASAPKRDVPHVRDETDRRVAGARSMRPPSPTRAWPGPSPPMVSPRAEAKAPPTTYRFAVSRSRSSIESMNPVPMAASYTLFLIPPRPPLPNWRRRRPIGDPGNPQNRTRTVKVDGVPEVDESGRNQDYVRFAAAAQRGRSGEAP